MKLNSITEVEKVLEKYITNVSTYSGDSRSVERVEKLLYFVGNPQKNLKIIHVAGTSGKTSTCYYLSNLLHAANKKVGLTVSPHVLNITERVQIDCKPISDDKFCEYISEFLELTQDCEVSPSYFEVLIAFAYWVFDKEEVEFAVIETGMGGLLDGTNVANRPDKICIITDIGFDHMHILGNTLDKIATQKAGIIQLYNSVFIYKQPAEVLAAVKNRVSIKQANLKLVDYDELVKNNRSVLLLPDFQKRNYLLAFEVVRYLYEEKLVATIPVISPEKVTIPGRMDTIFIGDSIIILDGAHNAQKTRAFANSYLLKYPNEKATIMLALKKGKEFIEIIDILKPISSGFILTKFKSSDFLPSTSEDTKKIKDYCNSNDIDCIVENDNVVATKLLQSSGNRIKIITGSFYLIGQIRNLITD